MGTAAVEPAVGPAVGPAVAPVAVELADVAVAAAAAGAAAMEAELPVATLPSAAWWHTPGRTCSLARKYWPGTHHHNGTAGDHTYRGIGCERRRLQQLR